jgi:hypothetical protein
VVLLAVKAAHCCVLVDVISNTAARKNLPSNAPQHCRDKRKHHPRCCISRLCGTAAAYNGRGIAAALLLSATVRLRSRRSIAAAIAGPIAAAAAAVCITPGAVAATAAAAAVAAI